MRRVVFLALGSALLSGCVTESSYVGSEKPVVNKQINNEEAARTRISLALKYLAAGDSLQAKYNLERAVKFAPELPETHYSMAYYYQQVGENQRARASYERALDIEPNDPNTLNNFGVFLCGQGDYDEATEYLQKAINIPSYLRVAESYENLAICAIENDEFAKAEDFLKQALNHNQQNINTLINLASMLYAKSDLVGAQQLVKRINSLGQISPRVLMLQYLVEDRMGHIEKSRLVATTIKQTYPQSNEAMLLVQGLTERSEFERLREKYRKTQLRKLQKEMSLSANKPKIKVVKRKSKKESVESEPNTVTTPSVPKPPKVDTSKKTEVAVAKAQPADEIVEQVTTPVSADVTFTEPKDTVVFKETPATETLEEQTQTETALTPEAPLEEHISVKDKTVTVPYHVVKSGENLFSISVKYNVKLEKLRQWNGLDERSQLYVGNKVYLNEPRIFYVVTEGDTLFGISVKHNILMKKLMQWNGIEEGEKLVSGRQILLVDPEKYNL